MRFQVTVDALDWVFGKAQRQSFEPPFRVQEVSPDGAEVWIGLEGRESPGIVETKYVSHAVPEEFRDRAKVLREMIEDAPADLPEEMRLIGLAMSGEHPLSYQSAPMRLGGRKSLGPVGVLRGFKKRPKKHR